MQYMTTQEAADYLRVTRATIWRWANKGLVGNKLDTRLWRFTKEELDNFVQGKVREDTSV